MRIFSAWVFSLLSVLSGLLLLPLQISVLKTEEFNVWMLFFNVIGISEMVVFGLNITFIRFISYSNSGIHYRDFQNINKSITIEMGNDVANQQSEIFTINFFLFALLSVIYIIIVETIGYLTLRIPFSYLQSSNYAWTGWQIIVAGNAFRIFTYTFPVFIQGYDKISLYYNIQSIQKFIGIALSYYILLFYPSILNLAIVNTLMIFLGSLLYIFYFYKFIRLPFGKFNSKLLYAVWDSIWKSGITKIIYPIITQISGLLYAQVASPIQSSSFLLTDKIFKLLDTVSSITFNTYNTQIASLRSKQEWNKLNILIHKVSRITYSLIYLGYLVIIILGEEILEIIDSKTQLAPLSVIILFSFSVLIARASGFQANLANQANYVIEHKTAIIYGSFYLISLYLFKDNIKMWVFPFALLIAYTASFVFNSIFSYRLYNTNFFKAEKLVFIPIFILLIITNIFVIFVVGYK